MASSHDIEQLRVHHIPGPKGVGGVTLHVQAFPRHFLSVLWWACEVSMGVRKLDVRVADVLFFNKNIKWRW